MLWDLFSLWLLSLYLEKGTLWEAQSMGFGTDTEEESEDESGEADSVGLASEDYFLDGGGMAYYDAIDVFDILGEEH